MSIVYVRLASPESGALLRAPALERLLIRASTPESATDWREQAFRVLAGGASAPPVAAAALVRALGIVPGRWVCIASPVHLVAGMTNVTLSAAGMLQLDRAAAAALAADFNRVFEDSGVRLLAVPDAMLFCVFDQMLEVSTHDPRDVVGRDVFGLQPTGRDAPKLRRLMSEIELWLFEHAVNRAQVALGRAPVTGLWLWGGGAILDALPAVQGWTAGADPLFAAFGALAEFPRQGAAARSGVLVCTDLPGTAAWRDVEQRWLTPLSTALRAGDIARVTLSVADRRVSVDAGMIWRFWRRAKPWWESFGFSAQEWSDDDLPAAAAPTATAAPGDALRGET